MRRVVVTGVGAVSPCGKDVASTWSAVVSGRSGIAPITRFDPSDYAVRIAGEVKDFDPTAYVEKKKVRESDIFIHFAIAAADEALKASGFEPTEEQREKVGTIVGVGLGGLPLIEQMVRTMVEKGPKRVSPYFIPATISNLAPGQLSMRYGFKGSSYTTTSACASGSHAIGEATRAIRLGELDACLAGGAEGTITGLCVAGFSQMRALSSRNDEPEKASRPWDQDRDGFVIAEGSGMLMLEEFEAAKKRGAPILAEVVGYGSTADAYHMTSPAPEGEGAQRAMQMALRGAALNAEEIGYVNAHATSTGVGDVNELLAIRKVFGAVAAALPVSSTKSMTGHLLGAAGALESVLSILALNRGVLPPTINLDAPIQEAEGLDLIPHTAREKRVDVVMNNSFGFGGTNTALIFRRV
ncbi:MAG: beta-ketoacyl-ACP synthase II [Myxococcales bacterium]|jgi:3-oxoacyl-[acyl-carrier-protein] synthase II|nr:beta-ketoacyl-ACP synthase II [Myxococcales bacterium]